MNLKRNAALAAATLTVAFSGLALGVGLPTHSSPAPTPTPTVSECTEDMECWDPADCAEIGNKVCGQIDDSRDAWLAYVQADGDRNLKVDPSRPFRVEYVGSSDEYPQNLGTYDLAVVGTDGHWYVFRAVYTDTTA